VLVIQLVRQGSVRGGHVPPTLRGRDRVVPHVYCGRRVIAVEQLESDRSAPWVVEQPDPVAEQHRRDVQVDLVDQSAFEAAGPDGRTYCPPEANQLCSRWSSSPPRRSLGSAMCPSSDMDMESTDADTSTSCGLDRSCFHLVVDAAIAASLIGQPDNRTAVRCSVDIP
jgi:hypothetical protein